MNDDDFPEDSVTQPPNSPPPEHIPNKAKVLRVSHLKR